MNGRFQKRYAFFVTLLGMLYLFLITFLFVPNKDYANTIIGFVLGNLVSVAVNWALGSSKGSADKTELMASDREQDV